MCQIKISGDNLENSKLEFEITFPELFPRNLEEVKGCFPLVLKEINSRFSRILHKIVLKSLLFQVGQFLFGIICKIMLLIPFWETAGNF